MAAASAVIGDFVGDFQGDFERTGPGTLAGRYLRTFWHPIAVSHELLPGRARSVTIMSELLTLYRSKAGNVHLVAGKCAHRAAQLSAGWVEGECIRCQYHGWMFDGTGQCVEQPGEEKGYAAKIKMPGYPVREHVGMIWAYLGEGEAPAFPPFPSFIKEGIDEAYYEIFECNYLNNAENDNYHAFWTHRTSSLLSRNLGVGLHNEELMNKAYSFVQSAVRETDCGIEQRLASANGTNAQLYITPCSFLLMPGMAGPDWLQKRAPAQDVRQTFVAKVPIDDDRHLAIRTQRVPLTPEEVPHYRELYAEYLKVRANCPKPAEIAREVLAGKLTWDDIRDYPYLISVEDMVSQVGEGRASTRPQEHLGRTDNDLIFRRRTFERELKLMAEGQRIKSWSQITDWKQVYPTPLP